MGLSDKEIDCRAPVWAALSDLFLDSEPDDFTLDNIANAIRSSGYSESAAKLILKNEVAPVFYKNLLSIAGDWQGWDENDVCNAVLDYLDRSWLRRRLSIAFSKIVRGAYERHWHDIVDRL